MFKIKKLNFSYPQVIALGFLLIILTGGTLLSMPFASRSGNFTPFVDALFTATSATCVTGQVVYDTYSHWSIWGQLIIITLIQTGGLGFMLVVTLFSLFLRRRIGLRERRLLMESASTMGIGGVVALVKKILIGTLLIEGLGAVLLSIRFIPTMGLGQGIYYALFHSISAFCNAGFDLMGKYEPFGSLTSYVGDPLVSLTICMLIVIGGIGFIVWEDVYTHKLHIKKYHLHSKIVLTVTAVLIFGGALLFYLFERNNTLAGFSTLQTILASLFQSITPRTAGYNTVPISDLSESGSGLIMLLMVIGGSPGSTAGGIKTTTLVALFLGAIAASTNKSSLNVFKRRLEDGTVRKAAAIAFIYLTATITSILVICALQPFTLREVMLEVFSCASTVGLTMGITPYLETIPKLILISLMYGGRVGGLTLALVLAEKREMVPINRPVERIIIG